MAQDIDRVGANLPNTELLDVQGNSIDMKDWAGTWTLLVFLRHLG